MSLSAKLAQRYRSLANAGIKNRAMEQLEHNLKIFRQEVGKPLAGEISYNKRNAKGKVIYDKRTGKPKKNYISLGMPRGLSEEQQAIYEVIVQEFLDDPTSTRKSINKEFNKVQELRENARRNYIEKKLAKATSDEEVKRNAIDKVMMKWQEQNKKRIKGFTEQQKAEDIDIFNRMEKEVAIKETIGSDQYQNMWTMAKNENVDYKDMIEALYAVTVQGSGQDISVSEALTEKDMEVLSNTEAGGTLLDNENIAIITGENDYLTDITPPEDWNNTAQLEDSVRDYLYRVMEVNR